jgi:thiol:disulfide interchange protein DsbD
MAGNFLPPDQAFQFSHSQNGNTLELNWKIEHGYYLYEQRVFAYIETEAENIDLPLAFISKSEIKQDKNFGAVPVFFDAAQANVDISSINSTTKNNTNNPTEKSPNNNNLPKTITIEYQGCAKDGLCYQPQTKTIEVSFLSATNNQPMANTVTNAVINNTSTPKKVEAASEKTVSTTAVAVTNNNLNSTADISRFLQHASFLSTIGIFLLLGIGLSLTPCILPMVPILSGIIVGHGKNLSTRQGILLSSAYVLGMASSYALAGILAATFGAQGNLQAYMQNPWVISVFAGVFVVLSLSMFGLYNLALPSRMQNALYSLSNQQKGGHLFGVFVMGALSALVVSPCVSAPLAGALVFISSTGDKLMGGLALFALGIGMGLPLIAIGAGGGKLVPKAGAWMNHIKHFFGVILLAVAIWLLSRIIPAQITMLLWAILLITYGINTGALEPATSDTAKLGKAGSFMLLLYGIVLFIGAMSGGTDPMKPLQLIQNSKVNITTEKPLFTRIKNTTELTQAIILAKQQNKTVMLDFYADWCTACIDMEKNVFSKAETQAALADFVVLQIDVTKNSKDDKEVLNRFNLFGPPSILFFKNGEQLKEKSLQGEMPMNEFIAHVKSI